MGIYKVLLLLNSQHSTDTFFWLPVLSVSVCSICRGDLEYVIRVVSRIYTFCLRTVTWIQRRLNELEKDRLVWTLTTLEDILPNQSLVVLGHIYPHRF